ncbi:MAG: hypothetical protein V3T30_06190 [Thermodesulfobacteriota bacterium]
MRYYIKITFVSIFFIFIACGSIFGENSKGYLGKSLPASFIAFSADSVWNTPIGKDAKEDFSSELMIRKLKTKSSGLKADSYKWSIPLFVIDSSKVKGVKVRASEEAFAPNVDPKAIGRVTGIPIPTEAWADPEKDGHMLLIDPKLRKSWDFSRAKKRGDGSWRATRVDIWDLNGEGVRAPFEGKRWWMQGARGSGFPLIAGLIRVEEIEAGVINHALAYATPINRKTGYPGGEAELCSPPASRTDGRGVGPGFIPVGARMQLDPELDLDKLGLTKATKVIAKAMQVYGMYNSDGAGTFKLYLQNLGPEDETYKKYGDFRDLKKIPIESFRVLKCKTAAKY